MTCIAMEYMVSIQVLLKKGFSGRIYSLPRETFSSRTCIAMEYLVSIQVLLKKGFSGRIYSLPRETFSSTTCIAMEYLVSIQVLLKKVSLVVFIVYPEKPFPVGLV